MKENSPRLWMGSQQLFRHLPSLVLRVPLLTCPGPGPRKMTPSKAAFPKVGTPKWFPSQVTSETAVSHKEPPSASVHLGESGCTSAYKGSDKSCKKHLFYLAWHLTNFDHRILFVLIPSSDYMENTLEICLRQS